MQQKIGWSLSRAIFPAVMTVLSFTAFVIVYALLIQTTVAPMYLKGLPFAIPFLGFGIVTYYTASGRLKTGLAVVITVLSILLFAASAGCYLFYLAIDAAATTTTDAQNYEKALKVLQFPNNPGVRHFPKTIPEGAQDVSFEYHPALLQGGEVLVLSFVTTPEELQRYESILEKRSIWRGAPSQCDPEKTGIFTIVSSGADDTDQDSILYSVFSRPHRPHDWNHGEVGYVVVHKNRNEILFFYENS